MHEDILLSSDSSDVSRYENTKKRNLKIKNNIGCPPEVNVSQILKNETAVAQNLNILN